MNLSVSEHPWIVAWYVLVSVVVLLLCAMLFLAEKWPATEDRYQAIGKTQGFELRTTEVRNKKETLVQTRLGNYVVSGWHLDLMGKDVYLREKDRYLWNPASLFLCTSQQKQTEHGCVLIKGISENPEELKRRSKRTFGTRDDTSS
ncbi:MAG: hypothetical protein GKR90_25695 [Pseudomonadales bacterium]|nr:hypothetical protein [Pseudomonadales bacterium]